MLRGLRGATTVEANTAEIMLAETETLLTAMVEQNSLKKEDIASAIFTVTNDLDAAFPAAAARKMDWTHVPLICAREIPVPNSLPRVIRVLMHINTEKSQLEMKHVYLKEAVKLRDDL